MSFEWDEAKRLSNLAKHGVDFRRAVQMFQGRIVEMAGFMLSSTRGEGRTGGSSAQGKPMDEKSERIVRMTLEEARNLPDMTDYARLDAMTGSEQRGWFSASWPRM